MRLTPLPRRIPFGKAALQDEDSKKPTEDVYIPCATPYNTQSPTWEGGDASSSES